MFIYGHVSSWTAKGIFYNLKQLKPGQKITVTTGNNNTYIYKVVTSRTYDYKRVDMAEVLSAINPNRPGLNLMTCTGNVIAGTNDFSQRLAVFTSLDR
jgi:sortase (surface protein transpeptidase)